MRTHASSVQANGRHRPAIRHEESAWSPDTVPLRRTYGRETVKTCFADPSRSSLWPAQAHSAASGADPRSRPYRELFHDAIRHHTDSQHPRHRDKPCSRGDFRRLIGVRPDANCH